MTPPRTCGTLWRVQVGVWSDCSAPCGTGVRSRSVACVSLVDGSVAPDATSCQGSVQPAAAEDCNTTPCATDACDPLT